MRLVATTSTFNHTRKMEKKDSDQAKKTAAHSAAYNVVRECVKEQIVDGNQVIQLSYLRRLYVLQLEEQSVPRPEY